MASRTLQSLFLAAQRNAEWSRRVSWAGVLLAITFHLGVWTPRLETARDRDQALFQSKALRGVATQLDRLETELTASSNKAISEIQGSNTDLPELLSADLERLRVTIEQIRSDQSETLDELDESSDEIDAEPPEASEATAEEASGQPAPFELVDDRTIAAIRDARTRDELIRILDPVVDQLVVRPRFASIRNHWQTATLPELAAGLDSVASAIPQLRSAVPTSETEWEQLIASIAVFRRHAGELEIGPPTELGWWALPDSRHLIPGLDPGISELLRSPARLTALSEDARLSKDRLRALSQTVAAQRAELLASPLGSQSLPIHALAPLVPALLGSYLALLLAGRSRALRELVLSTQLHIEKGAPPILGMWCLQQFRWDLAIRPMAGPARFSSLQVLATLTLGSLWIAATVLQLISLSAVDQEHLLMSAAAGVIALLIATIQRMAIVSASRKLLDQPAEQESDSLLSEPGHDTDLIDAPLLERE